MMMFRSFLNVLFSPKVPETAGNVGILKPGDAQWMTCGRGIVHSEATGDVDLMMALIH